MKWIISAGGPLIFMERVFLSKWKGVFGVQKEMLTSSDYERACEVDDYIGVIPIDSGKAVVLGQEPMDTSWLPLSHTQGIIVRWVWANSEIEVDEVLTNFSLDQEWQETAVTVEFKTENMIIFDSAERGSDLSDYLNLSLAPGNYSISTLFYEPSKETKLLLHLLRGS